MRLNAVSIGEAVPLARFKGAVHSVFRAACNVETEDGSLITLLAADQGDGPQGVRLGTSQGFAFDALDLRPRQLVSCRSGIVRFADSGLIVDLRQAQIWRVDLADLHIDLSRPEARRAWDVAWQELQGYRSGLEDDDAVLLGSQWASEAIAALIDSTRRLDAEAACAAAERLIGLGSGLTPSGDDFLAGYLAGLWSAIADVPPRRAFVSALGADIVSRADRTHAISRAYLAHAAHGRVSSLIASLVREIGEGTDTETLKEAVRAALRVGHTSGADGVAGLLMGLAAWAGLALDVRIDLAILEVNLKSR